MTPTKSVLFWLDGVIVPPLWARTRLALEAHGVVVGSDLCFTLMDLARDLRAGTLSGDAYYRHVIERASPLLSQEQLAVAIESQNALPPGLPVVLKELSSSLQLYLFADYPRHWLLNIVQRLGLAQLFREHHIAMSEQRGETEPSAAALRMLSVLNVTPDEGLVIDGDPFRAMASLRAGLNTALFIDAPRLRREFVLRSMLPSRGLHLQPVTEENT